MLSKDSHGFKASSCEQQRLWSDWADAQADPSLCWMHKSFCWDMSCTGTYHNDSNYSDRQVWAKSVDPDQTDLGLLFTYVCIYHWFESLKHASCLMRKRTLALCSCDPLNMQWGHTSSSFSEVSSSSLHCVSEQQRLWWDRMDTQACLSLP